MGGACGTYGNSRGVYSILEGKPEGKMPLERPKLRREDNIKMDLQVVGWGILNRGNQKGDCSADQGEMELCHTGSVIKDRYL
jgi:hypothetical protein